MKNNNDFLDFSIQDNKLVYYWNGINILGINDLPAVNCKAYYQFQYPLFSTEYYSYSDIREFNNNLLREIGRNANIDIHELLDSDEFIFLCIAKKPTDTFNERVGYQIRIFNREYHETFQAIKNFLINQLKISKCVIEKLYNAANKIFIDNEFVTFPIFLLGIGKYSENDIPYAQIYITNNPNTNSGNVNKICKKDILQNTITILKSLNLDIDLSEISSLVEFAYSKDAFLCFYGFDIHIEKIKKYKLYFRFDKACNTIEVLKKFGELLNILNTISLPYPDDIVDFVAFSFVPTEKNKFVLDGIQIYQK